MRVLLVHRYFSPDTPPYGHMLRDIADALAGDGYEVTVLTCQPSYNRAVVAKAPRMEVLNGVTIRRLPVLDDRESTLAKVLNLVWFCLNLVRRARLFTSADVVMAASTPPVLLAMTCSMLGRLGGADFLYHKQDIWPEVSLAEERKPSFPLRFLRRMDALTDRKARRVVVLSEDMARTVEARGVRRCQIVVLNNFDPWNLVSELPKDRIRTSKCGLDILFAGNLGRFQGLGHVVQLIKAVSDEEQIRWHFFGDGPMRPLLQDLAAQGAPVTLYGYRPPEEIAEFARSSADLGIVALNPGVVRCAYPSKTMTYLRNGCPLLALVEPDSEIATMIRDEALGLVAAQDDTSTLAAGLRALVNDPAAQNDGDQRALSVYQHNFSRNRQLQRWRELFAELAS